MMTHDEPVSVIMPAYNSAAYIAEAIESILAQTYPHFEFIIVDDGSTDDTRAIIQQYARQDARIVPLQMPQNSGASAARNAAIELAQHEWIVAMDADDIARPHRIETLLNAAKNDPEVVVWGSYLTRINVNGDVLEEMALGVTSKEAFYALDRTKQIIELFNPCAMFRRSVFMAVGGYDAAMSPSEDSDLWDRMAEHGPIVIIPQSLLLYRLHDKSLTIMNQVRMRQIHRYIIERYIARQQGKQLTFDAFMRDFNDIPAWQRFVRYCKDRSRYYSKLSVIAWGRKHRIRALCYGMVATALNPFFVLSRARLAFNTRQQQN